MNEGDRVETPEGSGTIVKIERYTRIYHTRYCVKLDDGGDIMCFDKDELVKI